MTEIRRYKQRVSHSKPLSFTSDIERGDVLCIKSLSLISGSSSTVYIKTSRAFIVISRLYADSLSFSKVDIRLDGDDTSLSICCSQDSTILIRGVVKKRAKQAEASITEPSTVEVDLGFLNGLEAEKSSDECESSSDEDMSAWVNHLKSIPKHARASIPCPEEDSEACSEEELGVPMQRPEQNRDESSTYESESAASESSESRDISTDYGSAADAPDMSSHDESKSSESSDSVSCTSFLSESEHESVRVDIDQVPVVELTDSPVKRPQRPSDRYSQLSPVEITPGNFVLPSGVCLFTPDNKRKHSSSTSDSDTSSSFSLPVAPHLAMTDDSGQSCVVLVVESLHASSHENAKKIVTGNRVRVRYSVSSEDDEAAVFDRGILEFKVGSREVIRGIDEGVLGMKQGDIRRIFLPPSLGYSQDFLLHKEIRSKLVMQVEALAIR